MINQVIELCPIKNEARVDSRILADHLGIQHKNILATVDKYMHDFQVFGPIAFKTRKGEALRQGGSAKSTRYAFLNEDQSYLLLTYSRNTENVRRLKIELVKAFSRFRQHRQTDVDYLPFYHELQTATKAYAELARVQGSKTPERVFHINITRLINKAFGLVAGQRAELSGSLKAKITTANIMAAEVLNDAVEKGMDYREAYLLVKGCIQSFAMASRLEVA